MIKIIIYILQQQKMEQPQAVKKKSRRGDLGLKMKSKQFENWECGTNYQCEKLLGSGSYGQVAQAI